MLLPQISSNGNYPIANCFYVYFLNNNNIKILTSLYYKYKIILIQITTTVLNNVIEPLILPKKIVDKNS